MKNGEYRTGQGPREAGPRWDLLVARSFSPEQQEVLEELKRELGRKAGSGGAVAPSWRLAGDGWRRRERACSRPALRSLQAGTARLGWVTAAELTDQLENTQQSNW